jgi:ABC-type transporter Mla subunit MlaD
VTAGALGAYLKNDLVPFLSAVTTELEEVDGSVGDLVQRAAEVLHEESAAVFAGIITSGAVLINELKTRIGSDRRLQDAIKEWESLAKEGTQILDEIVFPYEPEDEDEAEQAQGTGAAPEPGAAAAEKS